MRLYDERGVRDDVYRSIDYSVRYQIASYARRP